MDDLLITDASVKKLTVNTLFERYMATKNIKERTKRIISVCGITGYEILWETFGVVDFKTSHVRTFFPHCQMKDWHTVRSKVFMVY